MENKHDNLDQLSTLVQKTKSLAETLIAIRQDEQTRDHKVNIIGTAMIHQRNNLKELVANNTHIHEEMLGQVTRAHQHKDHIEQLVETADNRYQYLQKTHEVQHEFIASFDRLQEKHQTLIEVNNDNYEEYNRTLDIVIEAVNQLQLRVQRMDVVSQTEVLTEETFKLYQHIQDYIQNRQTFHTKLHDTIELLNEEIDTFNQTIQTHQSNITDIRKVVESCDNQASTIDNKLDEFIEQYNIKVRALNNTLDDAFTQPNQKERQSRGFFAKLFGGDSNE